MDRTEDIGLSILGISLKGANVVGWNVLGPFNLLESGNHNASFNGTGGDEYEWMRALRVASILIMYTCLHHVASRLWLTMNRCNWLVLADQTVLIALNLS